MPNPQVSITDAVTGETIVRPMTSAEMTQRNTDVKAWELEVQAASDKAAADTVSKAALLTRLGITADEAKLLLG